MEMLLSHSHDALSDPDSSAKRTLGIYPLHGEHKGAVLKMVRFGWVWLSLAGLAWAWLEQSAPSFI